MLFMTTNSLRICTLFRKLIKFKTLCRGFIASTRLKIHDIGLSDIPNVSVADMKKELRIDGFPIKDGYACLVVKCPMCSHSKLTETAKESEPKIYVNKVTGYFICPTCNRSGDWLVLQKLLRKGLMDPMIVEYLQYSDKMNTQFKKEWDTIKSRSKSLMDLSEAELHQTLEIFNLPVFPECARVMPEVRLDQSSTVLYFPLTNAVDRLVGYQTVDFENEHPIINVNERNVGGHFTCRVHKTSKERTAILVPSIKDLFTLAACRVPGSLIWWRSSTLPPLSLASLEPYNRVVVWGSWSGTHLDPAGGAWGGMARSLADKVGLDRCHFVRPVEGQSSAVEASQSGLNVKALVSEAQPAAHRSVATFAALRQDILADLHNSETVKGVKWKRFPALSRLLQGHRRGELTVLTGPTGCGKTTLMAEYSLDLAMQGVTTLWGSFEIKNSRLARTMLHQMAGAPLEECLDRFDSFADKFEQLPIYFLMFHGAQSIKVVMEAVEHATYVHDIAHVIIDNVQFMMGVGDDVGSSRNPIVDKYWKQDAIISSFRTFATRRNCHVTLVMHPRKERDVDDLSTNSIFGSAKASQEADNVLIIQDKRLTSIRGKKYLQIAKNRFSGDLGIVPLEFDKDSLSYAAKKKPKTTAECSTGEDISPREHSDDVLN